MGPSTSWLASCRGSLDRGDPQLTDLLEKALSSLPSSPEIIPSRSLSLLIFAAMSATLCEIGRLDDARRHFELLMDSELDELLHGYTMLAIPACASVACAAGQPAQRQATPHILEPHGHRLINMGPSRLGATTHYLGLLAATLDRPDEADARYSAAEASYA